MLCISYSTRAREVACRWTEGLKRFCRQRIGFLGARLTNSRHMVLVPLKHSVAFVLTKNLRSCDHSPSVSL